MDQYTGGYDYPAYQISSPPLRLIPVGTVDHQHQNIKDGVFNQRNSDIYFRLSLICPESHSYRTKNPKANLFHMTSTNLNCPTEVR